MPQWLPPLALHRIVLVAAHVSFSPWTPAAPFLAEGPATDGNIVNAAVQSVLGYGFVGVVALSLAWILYKGKFVPQERVDALVAAARADLLRENEQLRAEITAKDAQLADNLRFAREDLVPLLGQFTAATSSLLPILQQVGFLLPILQQAVFRQQNELPPRRDLP